MDDPLAPRETLALSLGGRAVAEYVWRPRLPDVMAPRPFLHPVRTMAGTCLTAVMPEDHRHHLGVSVAVPEAGGANFWGGRTFVRGRGSVLLPNHGVQRHHRWLDRSDSSLAHLLRWTGPDGTDLLRERRSIAARPVSDTAWLLDFDFELTNLTPAPLAVSSPAVNGRPGAGYGGFFWRVKRTGHPVRVIGPGGRGGEDLHGARAPWIALASALAPAWTLVFVAVGHDDRWFVRSGDYVGVGSSLAWDAPLIAGLGSGPRRRIITVVADGLLEPERIDALAARLRAAS